MILMRELKTLKDTVNYLKEKPSTYAAGWLSCQAGYRHAKISTDPTIQNLFDQGYGDCYANGECLLAEGESE